MLKKLRCGEMAFLLGTILSALGIAIQTKADLGISMVAAPAYILSLKIQGMSFGFSECLIQGILFITCCVAVKKLLLKNIWSFILAIPYAWVLDCMMIFVKNVIPTTFLEQLLIYLLGTFFLAMGIAFFFKSYLPAQVYEMFVKTLSENKGWNINKVKITFDWLCCLTALFMSLLFFGTLKGIGLGTIICTILNGPTIALCGRFLDKYLNFEPMLKVNKRY